jgi:PilZ domain
VRVVSILCPSQSRCKPFASKYFLVAMPVPGIYDNGTVRAVGFGMQSTSPDQLVAGLSARNGERRKNARFDMRFPVLLRALGGPWIATETADVSATGAMFVTERPFLLNAPIEYVLRFPPELTKAPQPLLVRFFGAVLRCERKTDGSGLYGVAVRNSGHRYLTREEAAGFDAIAQNPPQPATPQNAQSIQTNSR